MKLPIYDIIIDTESEDLNMSCISLVTDPAVEKDFECFSKNNKPMQFSITNPEKHCITGVAIRADIPIYRYSPDKGEYYVRFSKETIEQIVYKYSKQNLWNSVSLEHSGQNIDSAVMVEFYLKSENKCPKGFEDVEDGSLMVTYKITDENLWDKVKNSDEINGFSIEIMADLEPTNEFVESDLQSTEEFINNEEDFFESLMNWLSGEDFEKKKKIFEANRNDILRAIKNENPILIDEGGDKATEYWIHSIGKKDGNDLVILYNPSTKKWKTEYLKDIDEYIISKEKIGEFDYSDTSYKVIIDDDDIIVSHSSVATGDKFLDAIKNKQWVQISYDDEEEPKHTGYRQCIVVAYGTTSRGNVGIRCYQQFGDTRTISPDYKIFLLKRLKAFKPMNNVEKWTDDILDGRYHSGGDKNLSYPLIYAYKLGE